MKLSSFYSGLTALAACAQYATADPIPHDARLSVRARAAVHNFEKRGLTDDLFSEKGSGPRYWAWCRVSYDKQFHKPDEQKFSDLDGGTSDWALIAGDDITVWGFAGECVGGALGDVNTGMNNVVGLDNTNQIIVSAYMGTSDLTTAGQDLKFLQEDGPGGKVEKGFAQCYLSVKDGGFNKIKELATANPGWPIVFTGHSLGGATAHISAVSFAEENGDLKDRMTVFTYGAPRAGNKDFQDTLASNQGDRMANFRHEADPVTFQPPWPLDYYNAAMGYIIKAGSSWNDAGAWELQKDVSKKGTGFAAGVADFGLAMFHKGQEHTGYFTGGKAARRAVEETHQTGALSKRDGTEMSADKFEENRQKIQDLSDDDLNDSDEDDVEDGDGPVGELLKEWKVDDLEKAYEALKQQPDTQTKKTLMYNFLLASVEKGGEGGGILGAVADVAEDVVDVIT